MGWIIRFESEFTKVVSPYNVHYIEDIYQDNLSITHKRKKAKEFETKTEVAFVLANVANLPNTTAKVIPVLRVVK